jgi:hypothetical protein
MNLRVLSATGGGHLRNDIQALKSGIHFVVGTPGRVYDLIRRGELALNHMKYVILDEADQMLEDLFAEQIKAILNEKFPSTPWTVVVISVARRAKTVKTPTRTRAAARCFATSVLKSLERLLGLCAPLPNGAFPFAGVRDAFVVKLPPRVVTSSTSAKSAGTDSSGFRA